MEEPQWVRRDIAKNDRTRPDTLRKLAKSEEATIRWNVAQNPNTPADVISEILREDNDVSAICYALNHPSVTVEDLVAHADSWNCYIRQTVAEHEKTPPEVLRQLANDSESTVLESVAANPNTPQDVLLTLADAGLYGITLNLLENPSCPIEVLQKFSDDKYVDEVRQAAKDALSQRQQQ